MNNISKLFFLLFIILGSLLSLPAKSLNIEDSSTDNTIIPTSIKLDDYCKVSYYNCPSKSPAISIRYTAESPFNSEFYEDKEDRLNSLELKYKSSLLTEFTYPIIKEVAVGIFHKVQFKGNNEFIESYPINDNGVQKNKRSRYYINNGRTNSIGLVVRYYPATSTAPNVFYHLGITQGKYDKISSRSGFSRESFTPKRVLNHTLGFEVSLLPSLKVSLMAQYNNANKNPIIVGSFAIDLVSIVGGLHYLINQFK